MKTGKIVTWGVVAGVSLVALDHLWPGGLVPKNSPLYWLLHPEERELRDQLTQMQAEKFQYWNAYLDSVTTGIDRVAALRNALDPLIPSFAPLGYPFLEMSFASMADPSFPGLPTPSEWNALLQARLDDAIQQNALDLSDPWNQWGSWPSIGGS